MDGESDELSEVFLLHKLIMATIKTHGSETQSGPINNTLLLQGFSGS